jgi:ATPase subunit of ABC transporter with duplicated ATPase domains
MITVADVTKGFGGRTLFRDVTTSFSPGRNYGLSGPNGSGKTTFMRILIGDEDTDRGSVRRPKRTGWLRQDHAAFDGLRVLDAVISGNERLWTALTERNALLELADLTDEQGERLAELEGVVAEEDGYQAETEAARLLDGLGISEPWFSLPLSQVLGGNKVRVLLARALFGRPEALLLDEPTNHLDMDSIRWLEQFLVDYDGALVVISHDRRFLNAVCDHIADIDYETIITYVGNYDEMVRTKADIRGRMEKDVAERDKKIAQLRDFIQRFGAGTRASQTRSRQKQIERLRPDEIKRSNIARPFIRFPIGEPSGKDVLELKNLACRYGDRSIFEGFHANLQRGDKVALLGRNGIGKTSLLRRLLDRDEVARGTVRWGHNARVGEFGHDHRDRIQPGTTVYEWLFAQRPEMGEQHVRALLGRMLFSGLDGGKPTATLSGGEGARLVLCQLMLLEHNVLLLDEPTDHLDLESISALKEAIERYEGTVVYATHDRDLASAATRIWCYPEPGRLVDFDGDIDGWLAWHDRHWVRQGA